MSERRAAEEGYDGPEPTESAPRLKRQGGTLENATRVSVRPSAFGPPRPSSPPPQPASSGETALADEPSTTPSPDAAPLVVPPAHSQGAAHVEQLEREEQEQRDTLSNSQFATRLSQLPAPESRRTPGSGAGRSRRPWLSIGLFGGMLALSAVSLLRYLKLADDQVTQVTAASDSSHTEQGGPQPVPLLDAESSVSGAAAEASPEAKQQTIMALVAEANRVLDAGDAPQAERLFGQVVALDEDNPRAAFGLSRIRFLQGNLSGAEGWIQLAIRKRPRRAAYHAHYAAILERLGNHDEALLEHQRAQGGSESEE